MDATSNREVGTSAEAPSADALLEAMSESVYVVDRDCRIAYWNPAAELLTGYLAEEVVDHRCRDGILDHVDAAGVSLCRTRCPLLHTIRDGETHVTLAFLHHCDGRRLPVAVRSAALRRADGAITGAVEVFHVDTRCHLLADAQLEALTDPLTGIANRRQLERVLRQRLGDYRRYGHGFAILFADIDHFKVVNDEYGHPVGDRLLRLVAATLRDCTRAGDSAGRWGGEEFLLVAAIANSEEAVELAERARRLVASTWARDGARRVRATLSIGVALALPAESARQLVKRADDAMLRAKGSGRNRSELAPEPAGNGTTHDLDSDAAPRRRKTI